MARTKVFVSYSRVDTNVRDEVLRALRAVPRINNVLWWDEGEIAIGDKFHAKIQQGLAASKIGILLLSNASFTSDYILQHESRRTRKAGGLTVVSSPKGCQVNVQSDS